MVVHRTDVTCPPGGIELEAVSIASWALMIDTCGGEACLGRGGDRQQQGRQQDAEREGGTHAVP